MTRQATGTQIAIHNPNNLKLIDYRTAEPLQGNLKDLNDREYKKLKGVLKKRGFDVPLFLWHHDGVFYLMDGHQRQRLMLKEAMNDKGSYDVPYILIEAKTKKEAKAKLLEITSQYGKITQEGFDEFIADLPEAEVYEAVSFDALPHLGTASDDDDDDPPDGSDDSPERDGGGACLKCPRHCLPARGASSDVRR